MVEHLKSVCKLKENINKPNWFENDLVECLLLLCVVDVLSSKLDHITD